MAEFEAETGKTRELLEELNDVLLKRSGWVDTLLPPIVFLLLNGLIGFPVSLWGALGVALLLLIFRGIRGQSLRYSFGGVAGVGLSALIAWLLGGAEGYFLPGIISGAFTVVLCLVSVIVKRPLVAWTSFVTRRWPMEWYWHPRVRPAYSEVTIAWGIFFALRTTLQFELFQRQAAETLGLVQLLTGWPALILLLIASYLYGLWRLQNLAGP
ncbi:MAG: DUF3159 domain-containing protein, partial [Anaerolineales bacterium]